MKRLRNAVVFLGALVLLAGIFTGCSAPSTDHDGVWEGVNRGILLNIENGQVQSYQYDGGTAVELPVLKGTIYKDALNTAYTMYEVQSSHDGLVLKNTSGVDHLSFKPFGKTIEDVLDGRDSDDPTYNFEVFWKAFNDNYAFFSLYNVDWDEVYGAYAKQVRPDMRVEETNEILAEMVANLNDDHVSLEFGEDTYSPYTGTPDWWTLETRRQIVGLIPERYVKDQKVEADKLIRYGHLDDKTGYINLILMGSSESEKESIETLIPVFEKAIQALKATDRLVVDVRFNQGGHDAVALKYAGYFTKDERLAFEKDFKTSAGYTEKEATYFGPPESGVVYEGKVYLLTSKVTVSAAEVFALAMESLDNVVVVGENTAGFFSTALPRTLPNGMAFTLSNERYYDQSGRLVEGLGIFPDIEISIDVNKSADGFDPALDWILNN